MLDSAQYYVTANGQQKGPYTLSQMQAMWRAGIITNKSPYWKEGMPQWADCSTIAPLLGPPPKGESSPTLQAKAVSQKKVLPAFLLCFFLGWLGVHAFYAGAKNQGMIYLGLQAGAWVGNFILPGIAFVVCYIAISVFWFSDLIRVLTGNYKDGNGNLITEW